MPVITHHKAFEIISQARQFVRAGNPILAHSLGFSDQNALLNELDRLELVIRGQASKQGFASQSFSPLPLNHSDSATLSMISHEVSKYQGPSARADIALRKVVGTAQTWVTSALTRTMTWMERQQQIRLHPLFRKNRKLFAKLKPENFNILSTRFHELIALQGHASSESLAHFDKEIAHAILVFAGESYAQNKCTKEDLVAAIQSYVEFHFPGYHLGSEGSLALTLQKLQQQDPQAFQQIKEMARLVDTANITSGGMLSHKIVYFVATVEEREDGIEKVRERHIRDQLVAEAKAKAQANSLIDPELAEMLEIVHAKVISKHAFFASQSDSAFAQKLIALMLKAAGRENDEIQRGLFETGEKSRPKIIADLQRRGYAIDDSVVSWAFTLAARPVNAVTPRPLGIIETPWRRLTSAAAKVKASVRAATAAFRVGR